MITLEEFTKNFYIPGLCPITAIKLARGKSPARQTLSNHRQALLNHIVPRFGKTPIVSIKQHEVEDWLISISSSHSYKNECSFVFREIMKEARRKGLIEYSFDTISFASNQNHGKAFTEDEMKVIFGGTKMDIEKRFGGADYARVFVLMASTGMRIGEAVALQWQDIHWQKPYYVFIHASMDKYNSIGPTKNRKNRVAPLPARVVDFLQPVQESGRIFTFRASAAYNRFKRVLDHFGIEGSPHTLRHTYNTLLSGKVPLKIQQSIVGHSSDAMTELYNHQTPDDMAKIFEPYALSLPVLIESPLD
jgi:integrase